MKIGIISDSHDNIENTRKAIKQIEDLGCKTLIHCGDFCAPFMMKNLSEFKGEVHVCFGNVDDRFLTTKMAAENKIELHGEIGEIEIDSKKIAFTHRPKFARGLASTGDYDAVFYGHTHIKSIDKINGCPFCNPGELAEFKGKASFAAYDTVSGEITHHDLK